MPLFYVSRHASHRGVKLLLLKLLPILLALLLIWVAAEPKLLQVERTTLYSTELDANVGRLRIVYLSDIHYGSWPYLTQSDLSGLVTRVNEQNPDLILLGGDYANDPDGAAAFFRQLPTLRATYGTYAVLGEHDRGDVYQLNELKTVMRRQGITPIINEAVSVRIGTKDIRLAGLDDITNGQPDLTGLAAQCASGDFVIFLAHDPSVITEALSAVGSDSRRGWFDLGLFGHTHGGQVPLLSGTLGMPKVTSGYRSGWYTPNRLNVLVSNGVGTSGLPLRLGCPPQLHVITVISGT